MSYTTIKSVRNNNQSQNDIVIQITRQQIIHFFRVIFILAISAINILAYSSNSPFLKELILSQVIIAMVCLHKYLGFQKTN